MKIANKRAPEIIVLQSNNISPSPKAETAKAYTPKKARRSSLTSRIFPSYFLKTSMKPINFLFTFTKVLHFISQLKRLALTKNLQDVNELHYQVLDDKSCFHENIKKIERKSFFLLKHKLLNNEFLNNYFIEGILTAFSRSFIFSYFSFQKVVQTSLSKDSAF